MAGLAEWRSWLATGRIESVSKPVFDIERVEKALHEAARMTRDGARDQRAGKFLGKQVAVENAIARLHREKSASDG
jgi:hypothetical protein